MRMMWGIVLLTLVVVSCDAKETPDSGQPGQDGGTSYADGSVASDAGNGGEGLAVTWEAMPSIPGSAGSNLQLDSVVFRIDRLQVIGDNGEPGNTTARDLVLAWDDSTGGANPAPVVFDSAPPALYSKVRLLLDKDASNNPSVEIRGSVTVGGDTDKFRIVSRNDVAVEVSGYTLLLGPGEDLEVRVVIDLPDLLQDLDFEEYDYDAENDEHTLDDSQAGLMAAFLDDLDQVFDRPDQ